MHKSIRSNILRAFVFINVLSLIAIDILIIFNFTKFYYKNIEHNVSSYLDIKVDYYERYFAFDSNEDLKNEILKDPSIFYVNNDEEMQIIDLDGSLLMDTKGIDESSYNSKNDVKDALKNGYGVFIGMQDNYASKVICVTKPIKFDDSIIGYIRLITPLNNAEALIQKLINFLLLITILVIIITTIFSFFISNSIIAPVNYLTSISRRMAKGEYKTRSKLKRKDEIGELSSSLNLLSEEILKRDRFKNEFIANISHELKTPLTSIQGWAYTIASDIDNKELVKSGTDIILNESKRLSSMVSDLLDYSRIITGNIKIEKEWFSLKTCIEKVIEQLIPKLNNRNFKINFNCKEEGYLFLGDENRIKQLIINLVDNAIKFSNKESSIDVILYSDTRFYYIEVIDKGIGISEKDLPYIFIKFFKGDNKFSNTGIGLSVCEEIVKLHDGYIKAYSKLNEGTTMVVKLPKGND